jgi:hypothetical protein
VRHSKFSANCEAWHEPLGSLSESVFCQNRNPLASGFRQGDRLRSPLRAVKTNNSTSNAGIDFDQSRFSACVAAILGGDGNVHERIACLLTDGVPLYGGRHVERSSERK